MDFHHQVPGKMFIKYLEAEVKGSKTGLIRYSWNLILKYNTCLTVRKSVSLHPAPAFFKGIKKKPKQTIELILNYFFKNKTLQFWASWELTSIFYHNKRNIFFKVYTVENYSIFVVLENITLQLITSCVRVNENHKSSWHSRIFLYLMSE